jgi:hypothetical protein
MLDNNIGGIVADSFTRVIDLLGVPCDYQSAKDTQRAATNIVVGFKAVSDKDTELVNSYGVLTKIITVKVADFPEAPVKFDLFTINGEKFIAAAVNSINLNGAIIGYKIYTKGK